MRCRLYEDAVEQSDSKIRPQAQNCESEKARVFTFDLLDTSTSYSKKGESVPWKECSVMDERLQFVARRLGVRPKIDFLRTDPTREVIHIGLSGTVGVV